MFGFLAISCFTDSGRSMESASILMCCSALPFTVGSTEWRNRSRYIWYSFDWPVCVLPNTAPKGPPPARNPPKPSIGDPGATAAAPCWIARPAMLRGVPSIWPIVASGLDIGPSGP